MWAIDMEAILFDDLIDECLEYMNRQEYIGLKPDDTANYRNRDVIVWLERHLPENERVLAQIGKTVDADYYRDVIFNQPVDYMKPNLVGYVKCPFSEHMAGFKLWMNLATVIWDLMLYEFGVVIEG